MYKNIYKARELYQNILIFTSAISMSKEPEFFGPCKLFMKSITLLSLFKPSLKGFVKYHYLWPICGALKKVFSHNTLKLYNF